ncbi:ABC transporter ATP-binding protein [Massilia sp. PAMC28688]|uniref:ABC transporter ATP-binding protein n=1 Tax=Massilia sp. PAMC28688 TaxID=2861283 RepID=UPI001C62774F|nr:ABC transporter ATP-binding protein [Massilia sp. PAMC28688]QYF95645.1 ABC transporter ATP-binding protein [Massilia sp. PAMC28688]
MNTIAIDKLSASHGARPALHDICLSFIPGEVTVIAGPNGCGKSTLLRCLARLHRPDAGTIRIGSKNVWSLPGRDSARLIAMLPQAPVTPEGITVSALVRYGRHPHQGLLRQWSADDERAVQQAMRDTGTSALAARPLSQLSGGQRQRCWLAMALAQETPVLLLDEPTSMLDLGHQVEVLDLVRQLARAGRTVVMVLHDLGAAARYGDTLVAMRGGRVAASGRPGSVVTAALVRDLYGIEADILAAPHDGAPLVVPVARQPRLYAVNQA